MNDGMIEDVFVDNTGDNLAHVAHYIFFLIRLCLYDFLQSPLAALCSK